MAKAIFVKKARRDYPAFGIVKGESYWWWKFMHGGKGGPRIMSKTEPRGSQLVNSPFLRRILEIRESLGDRPPSVWEAIAQKNQAVGRLKALLGQESQKWRNLPESLKGDKPGPGRILMARGNMLRIALGRLEEIHITEALWQDPSLADSRWGEIKRTLTAVGLQPEASQEEEPSQAEEKAPSKSNPPAPEVATTGATAGAAL